MSVDYRAIYDHVYAENPSYLSPLTSPGLKLGAANARLIRHAGQRHLDIGCGPGFLLDFTSSAPFSKEVSGADISARAIAMARGRLPQADLRVIDGSSIPFEDGAFDLITCFDVLEHLDEEDVIKMRDEIERMMAPDSMLIANISLRLSRASDVFGDNLHRSVRPYEWWLELFDFTAFAIDDRAQSLVGLLLRGELLARRDRIPAPQIRAAQAPAATRSRKTKRKGLVRRLKKLVGV